MNWGLIAIAAVTAAGGLANYVMLLSIRAGVAELRTEIADQRREDRQEIQAWVEARYERSARR